MGPALDVCHTSPARSPRGVRAGSPAAVSGLLRMLFDARRRFN
jgi:hypothetical protein